MTHGLTNLRFVNAKQAGEIYKNIKRKLHMTIAAIWFNNKTQHDCHHNTKVKPEAATAVTELLMKRGETPETCGAVNKRQDNKVENYCIWFVIYLNQEGVPTFRNNLLSSSSQYIPLKRRKITYSKSYHTTDTLAFSGVASEISQLLFEDYQMLLCNWQHLLPGHLGYDALLRSHFAVSLPISPQHRSCSPWTPHILQKWVKFLPFVRKVRVKNSVNNCQHTLRSNSKER
jgi:hypothetical protein